MGHIWKADKLCKYVLRSLKCLLIVWYLLLVLSYSVFEQPFKTNYLWLGYNWSIVSKSTTTIGNEILPPSLEKSLWLVFVIFIEDSKVKNYSGINFRDLSERVANCLWNFYWFLPQQHRQKKKNFLSVSLCHPKQISLKQKCKNKYIYGRHSSEVII